MEKQKQQDMQDSTYFKSIIYNVVTKCNIDTSIPFMVHVSSEDGWPQEQYWSFQCAFSMAFRWRADDCPFIAVF